MRISYIGLKEIRGALVVLDNSADISFEEMVELVLEDGSVRSGRVVYLDSQKAIVQVFEGTQGISLKNTMTKCSGHSLTLPVSEEILGRIFSGAGKAIDGLGEVCAKTRLDVNGRPLNPVSRAYPKDFIQTGISAIDALTTVIRGQKLPIFSGAGMQHDKLAVQIINQASVKGENKDFCVVFAAMGVKSDVAAFFRKSFENSGVINNVVMFLNLANDPIVERVLAPRCALTAAEYLAYEKGKHVLVILTDMTSYAEAVRELSSSKGEIPGRKGYPGYLYSDLAAIYERAGIIEDQKGSITQIPILTMPNDDVTHPVPDLTGYITEGQIVLDRNFNQRGIYPPIAVLPSLSRLMKDGIGEGFTRFDHTTLTSQLFSSYAKAQEARELASVIGEDELSDVDKKHLQFGRAFEEQFIEQAPDENRTIERTLDLGWQLLSMFSREELDRVDDELFDKIYAKGNLTIS